MPKIKHPYSQYEKYRSWKIVERAIKDLVGNQDLKELMPRQYIVGYILKLLDKAKLLKK